MLLQGVTRGLKEVTGGYKMLQGIAGGYKVLRFS